MKLINGILKEVALWATLAVARQPST